MTNDLAAILIALAPLGIGCLVGVIYLLFFEGSSRSKIPQIQKTTINRTPAIEDHAMLNCSTVKVDGVNEIAIVHSNNTYSAITSRHPSWARTSTDTIVYPVHFPSELLNPSLSDWVKNNEDVVELLKYIQQIPHKLRNKTVRGVGTNSEYYICANNEKDFTILTIQRTPNFYK